MNQKSLYKKKVKELDWEKELYILFSNKVLLGYEPPTISLKEFINQTLTQQRTEILEEVKKGTYIITYFEDKLEDSRKELLEQILNLECLKEEKISKELKTQAKELEKMNEYCVSADEILEDIGEKYNERNQLRKEIKEEINKL